MSNRLLFCIERHAKKARAGVRADHRGECCRQRFNTGEPFLDAIQQYDSLLGALALEAGS